MNMQDVHQVLVERLGPRPVLPAVPPLESVLSVVLGRNTGQDNAIRAIENLRRNDLLDPRAWSEMETDELAEWLRPSGNERRKAARLRGLARLILDEFGGSTGAMLASSPGSLRERLLSINGISLKTADMILLLAAGSPTFVVGAGSHRIAARHGWIGSDAGHEEVRACFEQDLLGDAAAIAELHSLVEEVGRRFCQRREARCEECPLRPFLPEGGPVEPD